MKYTRHMSNISQNQRSKPNQIRNEAGGYAYEADKWTRLNRFLILGTDADTYYADARELTLENALVIQECLVEDGKRVVDTILDVSKNGRALSNSPALFALALATAPKYANQQTNAYALAMMPEIARTGTALFEFVAYAEMFRGWGRAFARAIGMWYLDKEPDDLAYQLVKYRQRNGWSHRDILRLAHPYTSNSEINNLLHWVIKDELLTEDNYINAFVQLQNSTDLGEVVSLINDHNFTHEMLPTQFKKDTDVWRSLLAKMPLTAMIRNLGNMSSYGLFDNFAPESRKVVDTLLNQEVLRKARVHPFTILKALYTYTQGHGFKGSNTWRVHTGIVDALNDAFYLAFNNVEPTNARMLVAIDISGSMSSTYISGLNNMPAYEAAAAEAVMLFNVEPNVEVVAFDTQVHSANISARQRIDDAARALRSLHHGGTDCSAPIQWAMESKYKYDAFVIMTDDQTWAGKEHVDVVFDRYQRTVHPNAKLILVSFVANRITQVEMGNPSIFRIVGLDADTPRLISDFINGTI